MCRGWSVVAAPARGIPRLDGNARTTRNGRRAGSALRVKLCSTESCSARSCRLRAVAGGRERWAESVVRLSGNELGEGVLEGRGGSKNPVETSHLADPSRARIVRRLYV